MREAHFMAKPIHDAQRHFILSGSMHMSENQLLTLSKSFAVDIIELCESLRKRKKASAIISQLLRSGTGIGANIHEANYASSRADFINKFQIALKECYETEYWLDVFLKSQILAQPEFDRVISQCTKLRRLLIASITTAKNNRGSFDE